MRPYVGSIQTQGACAPACFCRIRFAHQAERFAPRDVEADAVDGAEERELAKRPRRTGKNLASLSTRTSGRAGGAGLGMPAREVRRLIHAAPTLS